MGRCWKEKVLFPVRKKAANISLNCLYLLDKFGHKEYFASSPEYGNYTYIIISFSKMLKTCSHEIAHYIQYVKWGRSSCESDLVLNNGKYEERLAKEREKFTQEIYQMIEGEISEWEKRWKEI